MTTLKSWPSLDGPSKMGNCQVSWPVYNGYIPLNHVVCPPPAVPFPPPRDPANRQRDVSASVILSATAAALYVDMPPCYSLAVDLGQSNNNNNSLYSDYACSYDVTYRAHPLGTNASSPGSTPWRIPLPSSLDTHSHIRSISLTSTGNKH